MATGVDHGLKRIVWKSKFTSARSVFCKTDGIQRHSSISDTANYYVVSTYSSFVNLHLGVKENVQFNSAAYQNGSSQSWIGTPY